MHDVLVAKEKRKKSLEKDDVIKRVRTKEFEFVLYVTVGCVFREGSS